MITVEQLDESYLKHVFPSIMHLSHLKIEPWTTKALMAEVLEILIGVQYYLTVITVQSA